MLQKIIEIVVERAREVIMPHPVVPNEVNNEVVHTAGIVVGEGILGILKGGNVADIIGMFQRFMSNESNQVLLKGLIDRYAGILTEKFDISESGAHSISSDLMPDVVSHLFRKVVDPKDARLSIQDISSYVLNEVPQLRSLVQMVAESSATNGGALKDFSAASPTGGRGDALEGVLAGLAERK
jgi:hypothetical protein